MNANRKRNCSLLAKAIPYFMIGFILGSLFVQGTKLNEVKEDCQKALYVAQTANNYSRAAVEKAEQNASLLMAEVDPVDVIYLAKMAWGEARGCSTTEQAATMWCVLNRVDSDEFPDTVMEVVTQPSQFQGYSADNPVDEELYDLAYDVLLRWETGGKGRVLPAEYLYFIGDYESNHFYTDWGVFDNAWDWGLPSPYEGEIYQ